MKGTQFLKEIQRKLENKKIKTQALIEKYGVAKITPEILRKEQTEAWEKGFTKGIRFVNEHIGKLGELLDEKIAFGDLPEDFDWDEAVDNEITENKREILK